MAWRTPSDEEIRAILVQRLDVEGDGVGVVVGVIDAAGRRVVAHGTPSLAGGRPLDGDTVFEIGSITKVFTSLLLADMATHRELGLADPVERYLPTGVTLPRGGEREITLTDLATHTSGLPRRPADMAPKDESNPYADYTVAQLHAYLTGLSPGDLGEGHAYSNLGAGLLGHVLSLRAGLSYEALVHQRITDPLGMADTGVTLSPDQQARLAEGHDQTRRPVPNWDFSSLPGAGALRSTANDLLTFLAAELGYTASPLAPAMPAQLVPRRATPTGDQQALGWSIATAGPREIAWHGGATGGYRCFLLMDRARETGVTVLTNSASTRNDDLAFHLLAGRPLSPPQGERDAAALTAEELDRLAGRYALSSRAALSITRDGARLFAQLTGQGPFEIFAESPTKVFWRVAKAEAVFEIGDDGQASALVLSQNGRDLKARRID